MARQKRGKGIGEEWIMIKDCGLKWRKQRQGPSWDWNDWVLAIAGQRQDQGEVQGGPWHGLKSMELHALRTEQIKALKGIN